MSADLARLRRLRRKLADTLVELRADVAALAEDPSCAARPPALGGRLEMVRQALEARDCYAFSLLLDEAGMVCDGLQEAREGQRTQAAETLARALDVLDAGLERLADGPPPPQVAPMAVLDDLRVQRRGVPIPVGLPWPPPWRPRSVDGPPVSAHPPQALARGLRPHLQKGLVGWLRGQRAGIGLVQAALERLVPAVRDAPGGALWAAGLAFVESIAEGSLAPGPGVRRLLGRLDGELKRLAEEGEAVLADPSGPGLAAALAWHVLEAAGGGTHARRLRADLELPAGAVGLVPDEERRAAEPVLRDLGAVARSLDEDAASDEGTARAAALLLAAGDALAVLGHGPERRALLVERESLLAGGERSQCAARLRRLAGALAGTQADPAPAEEGGLVLPAALLSDLRQVQAVIERLDEDAPVNLAGPPPAADGGPDEPWLSEDLQSALDALTPVAGDDASVPEPTLAGIDLATLADRARALLTDDADEPAGAVHAGPPGAEPAPPLAEALRAEGMALDAAALDNLGEIASAIGDAHGDVERRVGTLRESLSDMAQTIHVLRGQVGELTPETEAVKALTDDAAGPLDRRLAHTLGERLQELSEGLDQLATLHESVTRLTRETESLLVRQARDHIELQRGLMRSRTLPVGSQLDAWRAALEAPDAGAAPVELRLEGGEVRVDQGVLGGVSPILRSLLELLARAEPRSEPRVLAVSAAVAAGELLLEVRATGAAISPEATGDVEAAMLELGGRMEAGDGDGAWHATLRAPLAPPLTRVLLVECAGEVLAVPLDAVDGVVRPTADDLAGDGAGGYAIFHGGRDHPAAWLAELLALPESGPGAPERAHVVFVRGRRGRAALVVDAVIERTEVVVRALGPQLASVHWLAGACVTGAERPVLILDVDELVRAIPGRTLPV